MRRLIVVLLALLLGASACTGEGAPAPGSAASQPQASGPPLPVKLTNWQVVVDQFTARWQNGLEQKGVKDVPLQVNVAAVDNDADRPKCNQELKAFDPKGHALQVCKAATTQPNQGPDGLILVPYATFLEAVRLSYQVEGEAKTYQRLTVLLGLLYTRYVLPQLVAAQAAPIAALVDTMTTMCLAGFTVTRTLALEGKPNENTAEDELKWVAAWLPPDLKLDTAEAFSQLSFRNGLRVINWDACMP